MRLSYDYADIMLLIACYGVFTFFVSLNDVSLGYQNTL